MAERMSFSRHSNPASHIAYIRAGHNSDFAFQKAVSGAPMPHKKEILVKKFSAAKNRADVKKSASASTKKKVIHKKFKPPRHLAYMKAPPQALESHSNDRKKAPISKKPISRRVASRATVAAVRRSTRVPKPKIKIE
jgi:hypothetical protein